MHTKKNEYVNGFTEKLYSFTWPAVTVDRTHI